MTNPAGFSVPEELLKASAHATPPPRRRRARVDAARWAATLLATSWLLLVDAGAAVGTGLGLSLASALTALGIAWTSSRRRAATAVVQAEATRRGRASP